MRYGMALVLLWPVAIALYAAGAPLELVIPAMVVGGAGAALFDVWWLTALAERIPPDKLSRVTSYDWAVSLGLLPLGYVLAGPAADALGATNVLLGGAIIAIVGARARARCRARRGMLADAARRRAAARRCPSRRRRTRREAPARR